MMVRVDEPRTLTLAEFLTARFDEDEAVAREAADGEFDSWQYGEQYGAWRIETVGAERSGQDEYRIGITHDQEGLSDSVMAYAAPHIARHDPARVLAEVEAKRMIVRDCRPAENDGSSAWCLYDIALSALALPYADHPDFHPEWRP